MKTDNRTHIQKATDVMYASARRSHIVGKEIAEQIIKSTEDKKDLLEHHREQLQILDTYLEEIHNEANTFPSCNDKCSGCCKFPIWANELEYLTISAYLESNFDEHQIEKIKYNFQDWQRNIEKEASELLPGDKDAHTSYTNKNVKCPFLIDNSCSIYEARPTSCRTYFSYGNPKACRNENYPKGSLDLSDAKRNVYQVPMNNYIRKIANGVKENEQILFSKVMGVKLLPLWFLG